MTWAVNCLVQGMQVKLEPLYQGVRTTSPGGWSAGVVAATGPPSGRPLAGEPAAEPGVANWRPLWLPLLYTQKRRKLARLPGHNQGLTFCPGP